MICKQVLHKIPAFCNPDDIRYEREPNALVATRLDVERFWDVMLDALARIG